MALTFKQPPDANALQLLATKVSGAGEPFVSFFTLEEIEAKLRLTGLGGVDILTPERAETRYFTHREAICRFRNEPTSCRHPWRANRTQGFSCHHFTCKLRMF